MAYKTAARNPTVLEKMKEPMKKTRNTPDAFNIRKTAAATSKFPLVKK